MNNHWKSIFELQLLQREGGLPTEVMKTRSYRTKHFSRCYGDLGSSTTKQKAENQQVTTQGSSGAGGTVALGTAATGNTINVTTVSTDAQTSQYAIGAEAATAAGALSATANLAGHAVDSIVHASDTAQGTAQLSIAAQAGVSDSAIANNTALAAHSEDVNAVVTRNAFQYGNDITTQNLTALQENTALAFSTIDHLVTGQTAGQLQAASDYANGAYGAAGAADRTYETVTPSPVGSTDADGGTLNKTYLVFGIIASVLAIGFYFKHKRLPA